jgi:hypothetical protein
MTDDRAHTRSGDPRTSYQAARAVTPVVPTLRQQVHVYAHARGSLGFCDAQMESEFDEPGSSLRTRRAELTERNIILDSGRTCRFGASDRERIVWVHRDFVDNPPPLIEQEDQADTPVINHTPAGPPDHLKKCALDMAAEFEGYAKTAKAEGRGFLAERMIANASLLRALFG